VFCPFCEFCGESLRWSGNSGRLRAQLPTRSIGTPLDWSSGSAGSSAGLPVLYMDTFFTVLGCLILGQSVFALVAVLRFARYAWREDPQRPSRNQPKAVIIVPCKGLEHDFEENIRALLQQDYRDYDVIFVTESEDDPAYNVLSKLIKQFRRAAWMVVAGEAVGRGQKVHNLCAAVEMLKSVDRRTEILVFADSDARPTRRWLSDLVAPLLGERRDKRIGATTGYRWYLPVRRGLASQLVSIWNSSALSLLSDRSKFAWGGGMAIRRDNFDKLGIKHRWKGAVSDDYALSAAIHEAGQHIKFVPQCLVGSHWDATIKDVLEFTTRQMRITRVYSPRVWRLAVTMHSLYNLAFWGGLLWLIASSIKGESNQLLVYVLTGIYGLGMVTGLVRALVATKLLKTNRRDVKNQWWAYALLGPLVSLIFLYNIVASSRTTRILWRGIGYEMISPSETLIYQRPAGRGSSESASRSQRKRKASKVI
jgi:ceramide glucosyltransferase